MGLAGLEKPRLHDFICLCQDFSLLDEFYVEPVSIDPVWLFSHHTNPVFVNPAWLSTTSCQTILSTRCLLTRLGFKLQVVRPYYQTGVWKPGLALTTCHQFDHLVFIITRQDLLHTIITWWELSKLKIWVFTLTTIKVGKPTKWFHITGMSYFIFIPPWLLARFYLGHYDPSGDQSPGQFFLCRYQNRMKIIKV